VCQAHDFERELAGEPLGCPIQNIPTATTNKMSEPLAVWYLCLESFEFEGCYRFFNASCQDGARLR
jgi:hypothetical protein